MTNMMLATHRDMSRSRDLAHLVASDSFMQKIISLTGDCLKILDASGIVCFMNAPCLCQMEIDDFDQVDGTPWVSLWPSGEQEKISEALTAAILGKTVRLDAFCPTTKGTPKWWDLTISPFDLEQSNERLVLVISRDITARVMQLDEMRRQLSEKDELLTEKDQLMHEVHHRAKNSLQLVQGLLGIQSRGKNTDPAVTAQLMQSSARVRTIAALHDRLYRSRAALEVEVKPYLTSLVNDIESSFATSLSERKITFQADNAIWTANDVPALGLVLTELMTNAVKYGAGNISVSFRQPAGEQSVLTVEDQGGHLPDGFDVASNAGLGMKLVTSLLRERGGGSLEFSCKPGVTSFIAHMPRPSVTSSIAAV